MAQTKVAACTDHCDSDARMASGDASENLETDSQPSLHDQQAELMAQRSPGGDKDSAKSDLNVLKWEGSHDYGNPQNWPRWRKWLMTCTSNMVAFVCTFASPIFSTASKATSQEFGIDREVCI